MRGLAVALVLVLSPLSSVRVAQAKAYLVDRAVVRFSAPDIGGVRSPRFVFERQLAFEARLEALADTAERPNSGQPYLRRHVRAALERIVAETLLSSLRVDPNPSEREIEVQTESARRILLDRVGGSDALRNAARAEGIADSEITRVLRRRARASLYLDRMVAPMLTPTRAELREIYMSARHPYRSMDLDRAEPLLRRWVVGQRLAEAIETYFQNTRQRLQIVLLPRVSR